MDELVLASSLHTNDLLLAQSSRGRVGKLSRDGWMECSSSRDGLSFNGCTQPLHRFFDFGKFGHSLFSLREKKHLRTTPVTLPSSRRIRSTHHLRPQLMDQSAPRSLRHEYDLFVENGIELYKESISRTDLLKIGDEAVASLHSDPQFAMNELLLCDEVDRIIRKRRRIPSYATWRRKELKRLKEQEEFRRPERWGVRSDSTLAREVHLPAESRVLVAGSTAASAALYLAAQGCSVTAIDGMSPGAGTSLNPEEAALFAGRIDNVPMGLKEWAPEGLLNAVVFTPAAFAGLTAADRLRVIGVLQGATRDGGVHLVDTIIASHAEPSLSELRRTYKGWTISVLDDGTTSRSFLARKAVA